MDATPHSLLERVCRPGAPNAVAWGQFVELYGPLLYGWAGRLGLAPADAADLVQDVFVRLVCRLPEFEHDRRHSFRAWLHVILVNRWRDRYRQPAAAVPHDPAELDQLPDPHRIDEIPEADYRRHLVSQALRLMQRDFQRATWQACWQTVVEGRPAAAVAAELGMSRDAVYAARSRVLRRLRQELAGLLD
jgi:RNA polymerase sigma-70 factor (ECF subfamily)